MSEKFSDATARSGLEPPRSLQGVEDAEAIWDTIARRFPNAAPLLREMEAVIERADDLLQQFKTPCAQEIDTGSSFHTPDSRESNATISMVSDIESFAEETNVSECPDAVVENIETQLAVHDIHGKRTDVIPKSQREQSIRCEGKDYPDDDRLNSSAATLDEVVQHFKTRSANKCRDPHGESDANVTDNGVSFDEKPGVERVAEKNSLEGWTRVADDALRGWHADDARDAELPDNRDDAITNVDESMDKDLPVIGNDGRGDKSNRQRHGNDDVKARGNNVQKSDAESSLSVANHRSPLIILEEYAKRCQVPIKYEYKHKQNRCVVDGDLCGYRAMSCAETQDLAKNELAAKILWLVAERQMDGSKLSSSICGLSDLSREEMLEIMAFNTGKLKNASRKLYKVCLEKGEVTPKYTFRKLKTHQGFSYTAECLALDCLGTGEGWRMDCAKISAAENWYQRYNHETEI